MGCGIPRRRCGKGEMLPLNSEWPFLFDAFALKYEFSLVELEQTLGNVEALHKRRDGADGHALAAGFRPNQGGRRGGSGCGHNDRGDRDGARGRHDGTTVDGSYNNTTGRHHCHIRTISHNRNNRTTSSQRSRQTVYAASRTVSAATS